MTDSEARAGGPSGGSGAVGGAAAPHPVDAVLAAIRDVPDSILRDLEPSTLFVPSLRGPGGTTAAGDAGAVGAAGSGQ